MKKIFIMLLLSSASSISGFSQYQDKLSFGKYKAGFEVQNKIDFSRTYFSSGDNRPINIFIWYPTHDTRSPITFGDYVLMSNVDKPSNKSTKEYLQNALVPMLRDYGVDSAEAHTKAADLALIKASASRGAKPASGKFPLVILGNGLRAGAYLHTILAEFLASHGYVCITVPSIGMDESRPAQFDQRGIDLQISDLRFAINAIHEKTFIDFKNMAVASWSFGGTSTALFQMQNDDIKAVVSLDGASGYQYGFDLINSSPFKDYSRAKAPYLHVHGSKIRYPVPKNFQYYDSISADNRYLVEIKSFDHFHFTSIANMFNLVHNNDERLWSQYDQLLKMILEFLNSYLLNDPNSRKKFEAIETTQEMTVLKRMK